MLSETIPIEPLTIIHVRHQVSPLPIAKVTMTSNGSAQSVTLLLVEDDIPTQEFMKMALGKKYKIFTAVSADEARSSLDANAIDLVLMDLSLKGDEDGLQLTRTLRQSERFKRLPIIALTAHAYERDRENVFKAGCDAYFSKPFNRKDLILEIEKLTE